MEQVKKILERVLMREQTCRAHPLAVVIEALDIGYVTGWNGSNTCVIDGKCIHDDVPMQGIDVLCHPVHAEGRAIARAARKSMRLLDATLYMSSWFPCAACAEAIVEAGIRAIVTPDRIYSNQKKFILVPELTGSRLYSFELAEQILRKNKVIIQVNPEIRPEFPKT